jgi:hypothetical protein
MVKARKYRVTGTHRRDKQDFLDLTLEKYDICISIVVVNSVDTGKIYVISPPLLFYRFIPSINATM